MLVLTCEDLRGYIYGPEGPTFGTDIIPVETKNKIGLKCFPGKKTEKKG